MILLIPMPMPMTAVLVLVPLIVIGALIVSVSDAIKTLRRKLMARPHGLLGKAYLPTFAIVAVGAVVIALAVWIL